MRVVKVVSAVWLSAVYLRDEVASLCNRLPTFRRKKTTFQLFFQSREQVVVRRGQIRRIGCVIKTLDGQVGQFLLGCKCPVSRDIVVQEQDPLSDLPAAFFLQNVLQLHQTSRDEEYSALIVWPFGR